LLDKIHEAHRENKDFINAYGSFLDLCRTSLNPNLSEVAQPDLAARH